MAIHRQKQNLFYTLEKISTEWLPLVQTWAQITPYNWQSSEHLWGNHYNYTWKIWCFWCDFFTDVQWLLHLPNRCKMVWEASGLVSYAINKIYVHNHCLISSSATKVTTQRLNYPICFGSDIQITMLRSYLNWANPVLNSRPKNRFAWSDLLRENARTNKQGVVRFMFFTERTARNVG